MFNLDPDAVAEELQRNQERVRDLCRQVGLMDPKEGDLMDTIYVSILEQLLWRIKLLEDRDA